METGIFRTAIKSRTSAPVPACDIPTSDDAASPCQEYVSYTQLLSAPTQSPHLAIFPACIRVGEAPACAIGLLSATPREVRGRQNKKGHYGAE